jgi:hypothetical protein
MKLLLVEKNVTIMSLVVCFTPCDLFIVTASMLEHCCNIKGRISGVDGMTSLSSRFLAHFTKESSELLAPVIVCPSKAI